jgi:hypothetical protein
MSQPALTTARDERENTQLHGNASVSAENTDRLGPSPGLFFQYIADNDQETTGYSAQLLEMSVQLADLEANDSSSRIQVPPVNNSIPPSIAGGLQTAAQRKHPPDQHLMNSLTATHLPSSVVSQPRRAEASAAADENDSALEREHAMQLQKVCSLQETLAYPDKDLQLWFREFLKGEYKQGEEYPTVLMRSTGNQFTMAYFRWKQTLQEILKEEMMQLQVLEKQMTEKRSRQLGQ